jgi:hypothetical protein
MITIAMSLPKIETLSRNNCLGNNKKYKKRKKGITNNSNPSSGIESIRFLFYIIPII